MSVIVFDFDGTLADSLSVVLNIYNNDIAPKWNLRPVGMKEWHKLRQMSITQGLRSVGVKPYQLAAMLKEGRRLIKAHSSDIKLFPGAAELLSQLASEGHQLYALSTNDQGVVVEVLKTAGITNQVQVLKSAKVFGKSSSLRRLLRQTGVPGHDAWMIGDELRDLNAAKRVGMKSIAVTWGFQPRTTLAARKPDAIASEMRDITNFINKL